MSPPEFRILAIDHIQLAIPAGAEPLCRSFFAGLLGMTEVEKPAPLRGRGGLWLRFGAAELHLGVDPDFRPARKAHPAFCVTDLDGLAERLTAAGHAPRWGEPLDGRRRFYADDPVGNRLEFRPA